MGRRSAREAGERGRSRAGLRATLVVALGASLILCSAPEAQAGGVKHKRVQRRSGPAPISVVADAGHPGTPVAKDFLGLSFEVSNLAQIAAFAETGNLVRMLRSLGPGQLRFGGGSADTRVAWTDHVTARPAWASSVIDVDDLRQLGKLAAASGWQIVLTIGLGHYEPRAAAREAAAAKATLGEHLEGIELGNEPNAFAQHGLRPEPWGFEQYNEQVTAYRAAIEAAAPGIPLIGPDVSGSAAFESWGLEEAIDQRPVELTGHHYPLGCEQKPPPSITRLLSPVIRSRELGSLRRYMTIAQSAKIPFRLDETNSVSCGGTAGISNTFASALWATGYLAQVMSMGVAGVNLHGNPANCNGYAPVCAPGADALANGALSAQPDWYALLLSRQLIGGRPLPTIIGAHGTHNLQATAFMAANGVLRFVIVDDDPPGKGGVALRLKVGSGFRGANILSLAAPSPTSLSGITLGGQEVAPDGSWSESSRLPRAPNRHGAITLVIKPSSAALLSIDSKTPAPPSP